MQTNSSKMDQHNGIPGFDRRDEIKANQIDTESDNDIIEISSDDDTRLPPASMQPPHQQQQNYDQSMNASGQNEFQVKTEIMQESVNIGASQFEMYHDAIDSGQMPLAEDDFDVTYNTESSSSSSNDSFLPNLKTKYQYNEQNVQYANLQTGPQYLMGMARPVAPSPTTATEKVPAASPAMVTSTTAPITSATPSPLPNPNYSTESQSVFDSCTSQSMRAETTQNAANTVSLDDILKNGSAESNAALAQLIESKVMQHMEVAMAKLKENYDIIPKNSGAQHKSDSDSTYKKQKRKLRAHENHRLKKERWESDSVSSLDDLFGPSTSKPKVPGKIKFILGFSSVYRLF